MGAIVLTGGLLLAVVGGVFFALMATDAGAKLDEEFVQSLRLQFQSMLPADPLGGRIGQALAFLVLVGPGLALFRVGLSMDKKEASDGGDT